MQVKQVSADKLKREYTITVPANDISSKINERLQALGKNAKVAGFRPGKVPPQVIKKQYGKNVMGEVLDQMIQQTSSQALADEGIRPALQPKIEIIGDFEEGKDLEYKMELEILPEIPEVDLSKIKIEKPKANVGDKEIDEALERIARQAKSFNPVDRKAKKGDAVLIDFKGFVGDEAFEGGEAKGHTLELGSDSFIPGFEDQLVGTKAGDKKDVNVTFPEQYHSDDLAGKEAKFEVTVHEVQEAAPQEVNDELATQLGLESLDKLKEAITEQMNGEIEQACRTKAKKALFDQLYEQYVFDTPEEMTELEFKSIWQQVEQARAADPDSEEFKGKSDKALEKEYREMAERRVRLGILLADIGNKQELTISQQELTNAIMAEARQYPGQEQKVFEHYQEHPEHLEAIRGPLLEEKVVDFILEKVTVKEVETTLEDLQKFD